MPSLDLPFLFTFRLAIVAATVLAWRWHAVARGVAFTGSAIASVVTALSAMHIVRSGSTVAGTLVVHEASGFSLSYSADALSAWFLIVLSTLAAPIALFSIAYVGHRHLRERSAFVGAAYTLLVGIVELVFVAGDAITFLFAWEMMTLVNAGLVATEHEGRAARRSAYLYLVMSHVATGCLIAAFFTLASLAGSLSFSTLLAGGAESLPKRDLLFALFFIGFGVKAGIIPLHIWLP
jgi:hydrogenase-4 component B